jgi:hypothetical protein
MGKLDPNIDVISKLLAEVIIARPNDEFCKSIQQQYFERGGLSKKQLEGLLGKAQKITSIAPAKLATLEAIIKRKHVTHKSMATITAIEQKTDEENSKKLDAILSKYPQHKAAIFLKNELVKTGQLTVEQKADVARFCKALKITIDY